MVVEGRESDEEHQSSDDSRLQPSFHGRLLIRSSERRPVGQVWRKLARYAEQWGWLTHLISQGSLFAGGVAVGFGALLLKRGEEARVRPEILIAIGLACVVLAITVQQLVKEVKKRGTQMARS